MYLFSADFGKVSTFLCKRSVYLFHGAVSMSGKILNIKDLDKIDKYNYCRYLLRLKSIGVKLTQREIAADLRISLRDVNLMAREYGLSDKRSSKPAETVGLLASKD